MKTTKKMNFCFSRLNWAGRPAQAASHRTFEQTRTSPKPTNASRVLPVQVRQEAATQGCDGRCLYLRSRGAAAAVGINEDEHIICHNQRTSTIQSIDFHSPPSNWRRKRTMIGFVSPTLRRAWPPRRGPRGRHMRSRYRCSMCSAIHINSRS